MSEQLSNSHQLAELVLSMDFVTEKGHRAHALARKVLKGSDPLQALRLIEHATAPTHEDGGHHEAAHEIASAAIASAA